MSLLLLASAPEGALVRVQTPTAADATAVHELGLDVWTEVPTEPWLDVRVMPGEEALLDLTGLDYEVRVPALDVGVAAERLRLQGPVAHGGLPPEDFYADYQPLEAIHLRLDELAALRPDLVQTMSAGDSLEGRALRAIEISTAPDDAPAILLDAGQHAREWIAVAATTCVAERLVRDAEALGPVLAQVRFIVVPVVNPDGYVYTWEEERYWRKNRRPPGGVDLNRNFPVAFGGEGSSGNPSSGNYRGEAPFSEPESAAIRDLAQAVAPVLAVVDVHSFGQLVLYPWGFGLDPAPADQALAAAADAFTEALVAPYGTEYVALQGAGFYPASGNIMDWAYGELGVYAYGLELRPGGDAEAPEGFVLPPEDIIPVCDELLEGVLALASEIADADAPGAGDDGAASVGGSTSSGGSDEEPPPLGTSSSSTGGFEGTSTGWREPLGSSETGAPEEDATGEPGCGCTSGGSPSWAWLLIPALRRRRNSRSPTGG